MTARNYSIGNLNKPKTKVQTSFSVHSLQEPEGNTESVLASGRLVLYIFALSFKPLPVPVIGDCNVKGRRKGWNASIIVLCTKSISIKCEGEKFVTKLKNNGTRAAFPFGMWRSQAHSQAGGETSSRQTTYSEPMWHHCQYGHMKCIISPHLHARATCPPTSCWFM